MTWLPLDTWIVVVGALAGVACSLVGTFLLLRRMSMMGDAISHAVLPGLALAYLWTGSRGSLVMFLGAAVVGVLTAVFTQWISRFGQVDRGASMGIVFTSLFALGLVLIVRAADHVDLDPGCVLYGAIELTPLHTVALLGWEVPQAAVVLGAAAAINLLAVTLLFKEFRLAAFDPALADSVGISSSLMHYLLMGLTAMTAVAAFEAVGSIIVIAMLIVPPATASLLTRRLVPMLALACLLGVLSAGLGHLAAITVPVWLGFPGTSSAGMMAVVAGVLFALTAVVTRLAARRARQQAARSPDEPEGSAQGGEPATS